MLRFFFFKDLTYNFEFLQLLLKFFNPITELVIPTGIPTKEAKAEIEKHPVTVETNISKCLI